MKNRGAQSLSHDKHNVKIFISSLVVGYDHQHITYKITNYLIINSLHYTKIVDIYSNKRAPKHSLKTTTKFQNDMIKACTWNCIRL
jgi:hypothetical protein